MTTAKIDGVGFMLGGHTNDVTDTTVGPDGLTPKQRYYALLLQHVLWPKTLHTLPECWAMLKQAERAGVVFFDGHGHEIHLP